MPTISAHIREPSGVERPRWPLTAGVPFAQGALRAPETVRLRGPQGEWWPCCAEGRATWPDGSLKWILLDAQACVPPMACLECTLHYGADMAAPALETPLCSRETDEYIEIDTGALSARLGRCGKRLFVRLAGAQGEFLRAGESGPDFSAVDAAGTEYAGRIEETAIEEANPLRLVVKATGAFVAGDGRRLLSWVARAYFYAHQSFFKVYHTFVHDQPAPFVHLRSMRFRLHLDLEEPAKAMLGAPDSWFGHGHLFEPLSRPVSLLQWNLERHTIRAESTREYRSNAHGWAHAAGGEKGLTLKLRRPWQNYPKAFALDGERLDLYLYPDLEAWGRPEEKPGYNYRELAQEENVSFSGPLRIPQGMAKTHEIFLHCGPAATSPAAVDALALRFEEPLLLMLPSEYYAGTGVFGPFQPFKDEYWPLELEIRRCCRPPNGLGMIDYGDQVQLARSGNEVRTRTTENLAYELPRSLLWQYLRARDQRLFWEGEAAVMHLMDIDTVHFHSQHPEWVGGPCMEWSQNHHYTDSSEQTPAGPSPSHTWLGSLLDYYFLSGYRRAREVAELCADYCRKAAPYPWKAQLTLQARRRVLDPAQAWPFSTRVAGWPLAAMGAFVAAFPAERFLRAMEALVDLFEVWQDQEGRWPEQIGAHNRGQIPFMSAAVLQGLQHYYSASGDERARRLLLEGARFLARQARTAEGIFFYKESPLSDTPHASTALLLGPLAFAYEQSGDPQILDAGYRLFRWLIDAGQVSTYMLKDLFAFMPLLDRLGLLEAYRGLDLEAHLRALDRRAAAPPAGKE